jgi:hypothetical protein
MGVPGDDEAMHLFPCTVHHRPEARHGAEGEMRAVAERVHTSEFRRLVDMGEGAAGSPWGT